MFRSSILPALALCAAGLVAPSLASAQVKIAVIDFQRALMQTAEIKKASADMQTKYKPRQDALDKVQRELNDIQTQLQASQGKLSAAGEMDLQTRAKRKQLESQRLSEDLQADVDRERNDILQRAGLRMTEIAKKLAEEKGLDMVVDRSNTIYFKTTLEITDDAITAYDKAHPVK
jgi:outer membrane protein